MENLSHASKFYKNNRTKVLEYKRNYYFEKTKYVNQFKNFKLKDESKIFTNSLIRNAVNNFYCFIKINDTLFTPIEFYEHYSIKNIILIEIEYDHKDDNNLILNIPEWCLDIK